MIRRRRGPAMWVFVAGVVLAVCAAQAEMAGPAPLMVVPSQTGIYADISPLIRIQGTGFNGDGKNLHLAFVPALEKDAFSVTVTSHTLSVRLKDKYRWPLPAGESEATLNLASLKNDLNDDPEAELLSDAVPVATLLSTPSIVRRDDRVIYMSGSKILYINGTNFRPKETTFWFDPPLFKETDYSMVVTSNGIAQLTLKPGRSWRSDKLPGPLKITRLDTGAGQLRIDSKYGGVTVAEVQVDLGAHGVTVETTSDKRFYQSSPKLTILGNGFNDTGIKGEGNTLHWANSLRGRGVDYTIVQASRNQLILELAEGSKWRANPANLPGPLTLLAVNAGAGPVPVGATVAKKGRQIATIYADPKIYENGDNATKLYRTLSHELWIVGEGFVKSGTQMTLRAKAPDGTITNLRSLVDYVLLAFNSTHVRVSLEDGKSWAPAADSTLEVVSLDTGAGPFPGVPSEDAPVTVATIVADPEQTTAMNVTRTLTTQTLYETPAKKSLVIEGQKLCDTGKVVNTSDVKLAFRPPVSDDAFTVESVKPTKITVNLVKGHKWAKWPVGALNIISIQCSNKADPVVFSNGEGVAVATVLANPVVKVREDLTLYAHHSKRLVIRGSGFSVDSTTFTLDPAPAKDTTPYKVVECKKNYIVFDLVDDEAASWIPENLLPAKDSEDKVPLKVVAIRTGAGEVSFQDDPPIVAKVVDEPEGDFCDDTCEWANDGVCDDGTQPFVLGALPLWSPGSDDNASVLQFACPRGTDCPDCQPKAGDGPSNEIPDAVCDNTCNYARDGYCDDGRDNMPAYCDPGTDCQDCGPVGADNFTRDDDEFWDDDDVDLYGYYDDMTERISSSDNVTGVSDASSSGSGKSSNDKKKTRYLDDDGEWWSTATIFILILEGCLVGIGAITCVVTSRLAFRFYKREMLPADLVPRKADSEGSKNSKKNAAALLI